MLVSTKFVNARINSMVKGAIAKHQHQKDAHMQSDQSPDTHNTIHWNLSYSIHSLGTDVELSGKFMTWAVGVSDHIRPRWCWLMFMFAVKFKINIKIRIFLFPNSKFGRFSKVKLQICTQINRQKNLHNFKVIRFGMIMKKNVWKLWKAIECQRKIIDWLTDKRILFIDSEWMQCIQWLNMPNHVSFHSQSLCFDLMR